MVMVVVMVGGCGMWLYFSNDNGGGGGGICCQSWILNGVVVRMIHGADCSNK